MVGAVSNRLAEHLVLLGLVGALVLPSVNVGIGINIITPISIFLLLIIPFVSSTRQFKVDAFIIVFALIILSIFLSINYGYIFLSIEDTYRDYMELFRYLQLLPYLIVAKYFKYTSFERKLMKYVLIAAIIVIVVSFFQITNVGGFAYFFGTLYATADHTESMLYSSKRVVATGSDPNVGAVITSFLLFIVYFSKYNNLLKALLCGCLLLILLLTQSRTALIGVGISFSILFIFFSKNNLIIKCGLGILLVFILITLFSYLELDYIVVGMETAVAGENSSVNIRFENISLAIDRWNDSWLFGQGPAKSISSTTIDSEYALILQRYGSVGVILFASYLLLNFMYFFRFLNYQTIHEINVPLIAGGYTLVAVVVMCTNNYFAGYQTAAIPILIAILIMLLKQNLIEKVKDVT